MLLTLTLVVFFAAILAVFSEEFIRAIKKLFAIRGMKLFLPLFIASWLIYTFDYLFLWAVYYYHEMLYTALRLLVSIMPFQLGAESLSLIIVLAVVSIVPVVILNVISIRNTYRPYPHPYTTSGMIWIITAVLLLVL